jgi:hypothetical protein
MSFISCSFKGDKSQDDKTTRSIEQLNPEELKQLDSDGDFVNDYDEIQSGRDRLIAELPELNISFLQNYKIDIKFKDDSVYTIDTSVRRDNPDFKYRVGNLYLKEHSLDSAARIGKYSGITWGKIKQEDFSMVKYPEIDKTYFHSKVLEFESFKNKEIKEISIELDNNLKLTDKGHFDQIQDLELNFYYKDHKKDDLVQIHTAKIEKTFQTGIRENLSIIITNPPKELVLDSFLRRGEFILSEVKDFYIPSLKTKYSTLLKSIKSKSVSVYKTTPLENELRYVAVSNNGSKLTEILNILFDDKYRLENQKLVQVEQFTNNLSEFEYLHELKNSDKEGKWFVMTNKLRKHYLKHDFVIGDSITLSYITGNELSQRNEETFFSLNTNAFSGLNSKQFELGNITKNSKLELLISPKLIEGPKVDQKTGSFRYAPPRCRNCTGGNWGIAIEFNINKVNFVSDSFEFNSTEQFINQIELLINNTVIDLKELIESGDGSVTILDEENQYIQLSVINLHKLTNVGIENTASLRVKPLNTGSVGLGLELTNAHGKNIDVIAHAGLNTFRQAGQRKIPIAVTGWEFDQWQGDVPWGKTMPDGYVPTKGDVVNYFDGLVIDFVSTITNNFN